MRQPRAEGTQGLTVAGTRGEKSPEVPVSQKQ